MNCGCRLLTLYFKVLFMSEQNQHLEAIQDIKRIMERSSRFLSLSGLSGIVAGVCALAGSYIANGWIKGYFVDYDSRGFATAESFNDLKVKLLVLAGIVLFAALASAFFFTWRRAKINGVSLWGHTSRKLLINTAIPLVTGGVFILSMLQYNETRFIASACLVFYGLALVNASKYTITDIRYLGLIEILLGLISTQYPHQGIYFWAVGFGVLHIVYGIIMWWKYERNAVTEAGTI